MEWTAVSSRTKLAANERKAAAASRADQRKMNAVAADGRSKGGTERVVAAASSRGKLADSWLKSAPHFDPEDHPFAALCLEKLGKYNEHRT